MPNFRIPPPLWTLPSANFLWTFVREVGKGEENAQLSNTLAPWGEGKGEGLYVTQIQMLTNVTILFN